MTIPVQFFDFLPSGSIFTLYISMLLSIIGGIAVARVLFEAMNLYTAWRGIRDILDYLDSFTSKLQASGN